MPKRVAMQIFVHSMFQKSNLNIYNGPTLEERRNWQFYLENQISLAPNSKIAILYHHILLPEVENNFKLVCLLGGF